MHKNKRKLNNGNQASTGSAVDEGSGDGDSNILDTMKETFSGLENVGAIGERATAIGESVEGQIHARPFAAVGLGVAIGIGVGFLLRRGLFGALIVAGAGLLIRRFASEMDFGHAEQSASGDESKGERGSQDDNDDELVDDDINEEPSRDKSQRVSS